jgi:hypothetical protein
MEQKRKIPTLDQMYRHYIQAADATLDYLTQEGGYKFTTEDEARLKIFFQIMANYDYYYLKKKYGLETTQKDFVFLKLQTEIFRARLATDISQHHSYSDQIDRNWSRPINLLDRSYYYQEKGGFRNKYLQIASLARAIAVVLRPNEKDKKLEEILIAIASGWKFSRNIKDLRTKHKKIGNIFRNILVTSGIILRGVAKGKRSLFLPKYYGADSKNLQSR